MAAGKYDIYVEQGTDWSESITLTDSQGAAVDLTGVTGTGQIRETYSSTAVIQTITVAVADAVNGKLTMSMTASQTSSIPVDDATDFHRPVTKYIYDLELTFPVTGVVRLLEGEARVSPEVTR